LYLTKRRTEELQLQRVMMQLGPQHTDLDRYIYLINLLDHTKRSSTEPSCPIRRDFSDRVRPTIGEACLKFGHNLPPSAWHVSLNHPPRQGEGGLEKLAAERRFGSFASLMADDLGLGDLGKRRGYPHRQAAALHRVRRCAAAIPVAHVSRRGH